MQPSGSSTDAAGEWLDEDDGGAAVERLEELRQELTAKIAARNGLKLLSMGMSADFETAIQLGATHVRVGSAIFGHR